MYIFIDESGNFKTTEKSHRVSCVAALIIPESFAGTLFRKFKKLIRDWKVDQAEIKGSKLNEDQVSKVLKLLKKFDVLIVAACVDMGMHNEAGINAHKNDQAERYLKPITGDSKPGMKRDLEDLAERTRSLANQLFTQAIVLNEVVDQVFRAGTLYYSQRIPSALGSFKWRIDAKDKTITAYETLWRQTVLPSMQFKSLSEPLVQLRQANYSAFSKFEKESAEPPAYLKDHVKEKDIPFRYTDLREILTDNLKFLDSSKYCGLQMVDIVASAITRACNGTLQEPGWSELGRMMVQNAVGKNSLRFLAFQEIQESKNRLPYNDIVLKFDKQAKRMLTKA